MGGNSIPQQSQMGIVWQTRERWYVDMIASFYTVGGRSAASSIFSSFYVSGWDPYFFTRCIQLHTEPSPQVCTVGMFNIMQAWNYIMHFITNVVSKHSFCRSVLESATISPLHTHMQTQRERESCWSHIQSDLWPLLWRSERTITVLIGNISSNYCSLPFFKELNRLLEILCSYKSYFILTHTHKAQKHAVKMQLCLIYNIKIHHVWVSVFAHMLWQNMIWLRDAWILRLA